MGHLAHQLEERRQIVQEHDDHDDIHDDADDGPYPLRKPLHDGRDPHVLVLAHDIRAGEEANPNEQKPLVTAQKSREKSAPRHMLT